MEDEPISTQEPAAPRGIHVSSLAALVYVLLTALLAASAFWLGKHQAVPAADSAEVGFTRDMLAHHAQAVDMATLLRDRTHDADLKLFALDIILTQQAQIGQMQGWMAIWGQPLARTGPAMEWMGMPAEGSMPGMASPEQLNQLRGLEGEAADALFLQLMVAHHIAGVDMAEAALERAQRPEVRVLAQSIVTGQSSEVAYMQELLEQKGLPVAQGEPQPTPTGGMEGH